ncbi:hypothetical protein K449DRAFT_441150, partial [Hypoxylon sp. EC38]
TVIANFVARDVTAIGVTVSCYALTAVTLDPRAATSDGFCASTGATTGVYMVSSVATNVSFSAGEVVTTAGSMASKVVSTGATKASKVVLTDATKASYGYSKDSKRLDWALRQTIPLVERTSAKSTSNPEDAVDTTIAFAGGANVEEVDD